MNLNNPGSDRHPGDSGMARLIRRHDWAAAPLGAIEAWPERLHMAVEMMLANPQPATLAVGAGRIFLLNDATARPYGPQARCLLGLPLPRAFPSYPAVANLYDRAFAGNAGEVRAMPLAVTGEGSEIFDATLLPLGNGAGGVLAVLATSVEVSTRLEAEAALREREERQAFLLRLSDALRAERDVDAVADRAIRMLADQMDLDRCYIAFYRPTKTRRWSPIRPATTRSRPFRPGSACRTFPTPMNRWATRPS